jgi:hypothetical protein
MDREKVSRPPCWTWRLREPDRGWPCGVPRGRGLDPLDLSGRPVPGWLRALGLHGPAPNTPACSRPSHRRSGRPSRIGTVGCSRADCERERRQAIAWEISGPDSSLPTLSAGRHPPEPQWVVCCAIWHSDFRVSLCSGGSLPYGTALGPERASAVGMTVVITLPRVFRTELPRSIRRPRLHAIPCAGAARSIRRTGKTPPVDPPRKLSPK